MSRWCWRRLQYVLPAVLMMIVVLAARAHDLPDSVRVQAYVRPDGSTLQLLLRVPLAAMTEIDVPVRGPGYLDLARVGPALDQATRLWLVDNIDVRENGERTPAPRIVRTRISLAADRAFADYSTALAHLMARPLDGPQDLYWNQQLLDVLLEYPIASERSAFSVEFRFARLGQRVATTLRFRPPSGAERAFDVRGDAGRIDLDPGLLTTASRFIRAGMTHIVEGIDHLLFLLALVAPYRRWRALVVLVTSFTLAHTATLVAAALGHAPTGLWFPPLVETLIALSIVCMALENVFGARLQRRWLLAFVFGLVHGFGFSFALQESLQFAGDHLVTALLAFNLGVELGQIAVLAAILPPLAWMLARVRAPLGMIVVSAIVAHAGWHWMIERGSELLKFRLPAFDAAAGAALAGWLLAATGVAAVLWTVGGRLGAWIERMDRR